MNRRGFLGTVATRLGAAGLAMQSGQPRERTRLILLGTAGGPRPRMARSAPAEMWSRAARKHFAGRVVVAKDLMEL